MRADHGADAVVRRIDAGDPVAQRLVDRVLERRAPGLDGHDLGAEELHPEHVEGLALDVDRAHEDLALEAEQRGCRRGGDPVLSGARLGDHALLAHPPRQKRLAEHVVDLVRARVREVLAFEQHPHSEAIRQPAAFGDGRRPARVVGEQIGELGSEPVVRPRRRGTRAPGPRGRGRASPARTGRRTRRSGRAPPARARAGRAGPAHHVPALSWADSTGKSFMARSDSHVFAGARRRRRDRDRRRGPSSTLGVTTALTSGFPPPALGEAPWSGIGGGAL